MDELNRFRAELKDKNAKKVERFKKAAHAAVDADIAAMQKEAHALADDLSADFERRLGEISQQQEELFKRRLESGDAKLMIAEAALPPRLKELQDKIAILEKEGAKALLDRVPDRMPSLRTIAKSGKKRDKSHPHSKPKDFQPGGAPVLDAKQTSPFVEEGDQLDTHGDEGADNSD